MDKKMEASLSYLIERSLTALEEKFKSEEAGLSMRQEFILAKSNYDIIRENPTVESMLFEVIYKLTSVFHAQAVSLKYFEVLILELDNISKMGYKMSEFIATLDVLCTDRGKQKIEQVEEKYVLAVTERMSNLDTNTYFYRIMRIMFILFSYEYYEQASVFAVFMKDQLNIHLNRRV